MAENDLDKVKKDLEGYDKNTFNQRADRLKELRDNAIIIFGDFPGKASTYFSEASNCYINGNFRACIFACSVAADQILRHEIIKVSKNKYKTLKDFDGEPFGYCIRYYYKHIKTDSFKHPINNLIKKFELVNEIRNILAVHPAYTDLKIDMSSPSEEMKLRNKLLSEDIYRIFQLYYAILFPAHIAGDKMKEALSRNKLKYYNGKKIETNLYELIKNDFSNQDISNPDIIATFTIDYDLLKPLALETYKILHSIISELYGENKRPIDVK